MYLDNFYLIGTLLVSKALALAHVCSSDLGLSYTGYKVLLVDLFSFYSPSRTHHVMVCHCVNGRLRRSKQFDLNTKDVFRSDLCLLNDEQSLLPPEALSSKSPGVSSNSAPAVKAVVASISSLFGLRMNGTWLTSFFPVTESDTLTPELCYKIARRKRYAWLGVNFFIPYTFVGGFYQCQGTKDTCNPKRFSLVAPLIADDSRVHWNTLEKYRVVRYTQFLKTASELEKNILYSQALFGSWANQVDINENYTGSSKDDTLMRKVISAAHHLTTQANPLNKKGHNFPQKGGNLEAR